MNTSLHATAAHTTDKLLLPAQSEQISNSLLEKSPVAAFLADHGMHDTAETREWLAFEVENHGLDLTAREIPRGIVIDRFDKWADAKAFAPVRCYTCGNFFAKDDAHVKGMCLGCAAELIERAL